LGGVLEKLIECKKKDHGGSTDILPSTIRGRLCKGRSLTPESHGVKSPVEAAEEAFFQICIQMGKIRQPLNVAEAIALMNDIIRDTPCKDILVDF
jgi:hypothetical protein